MIGFIYLIQGINGTYIGQSINYKKRWETHKTRLRNNTHENRYLQRAWNKYGESAFEFKVIQEYNETTKEKLTEAELFWRDTYRNAGVNLFNMAEPGLSPTLGCKLSDKHRKNLSKAQKGRVTSEKTKKKLSLAMKGKKNALGCKRTQEFKDNVSKFQKCNQWALGYKHTEEAKKKISKATQLNPVNLLNLNRWVE